MRLRSLAAVLAAVVMLAFAAGASAAPIAAPHHHSKYAGGCNTSKCVARVQRRAFARAHGGCQSWTCVARVKHKAAVRWAKAHPLGTASALARCVAARESTMRRVTPGPYHSYFQWLVSTWLRAGGGRFASVPENASFAEQAYVFDHYAPNHRGEWPNTIPACGG